MMDVLLWSKSTRWTHWFFEDGFGVEVCMHSEKKDPGPYDFPRYWNTYLYFCDQVRFSKDGKLCEPYIEPCPLVSYLWENREALDGLGGWNGGPTFHEFTTAADGQRRIKIGDDYQHLWDGEDGRFRQYNPEYMQRQALLTAEEARSALKRLMKG